VANAKRNRDLTVCQRIGGVSVPPIISTVYIARDENVWGSFRTWWTSSKRDAQ
jgi:hypothetical protein